MKCIKFNVAKNEITRKRPMVNVDIILSEISDKVTIYHIYTTKVAKIYLDFPFR